MQGLNEAGGTDLLGARVAAGARSRSSRAWRFARCALVACTMWWTAGHASTLDERLEELARDAPGSAVAAQRAVDALSAGATSEARIDAWMRWVVAGVFADSAVPVPPIPDDIVALAASFGLRTAHGLFVAHNVGRAQATGGAAAVRGPDDLTRSVESVRAGGEPTALCLVLLREAQAHLSSLDKSASTAAFMEAAHAPGASPQCQALVLYGLLLSNGYGLSESNASTLEPALAAARRGLALAPPERYPSLGGRLLLVMGYTLSLVGRHADGLPWFERALPLARRGGDRGLLVRTLLMQADAELSLGDAPAALPAVNELLGIGRVTGPTRFSTLLLSARVHAALDPPDTELAKARLAAARAWLGDVKAPDQMQRTYLDVARPVFESLGMYREALQASKALLALEQAGVAAQLGAKLAEQSVRFDVQRRELETEKLRIVESEMRTRRNLLATGLALSVVVIVITGVLLRLQVLQRQHIAGLYAQLEQLNATRSQWLARAVHDLRQPAHSLALLTEASLAGPGPAPPLAEDIRRNTQSLCDMLSGLLDLTQLDRGDYRPVVAPFELDQLLLEVSSQFRPVCGRKRLALTVDACGLWVLSDPQLLRRIVFNLVSNAAKYTDRGSVVVRVQADGELARLQVIDTGRGIPAERMADMLRPYSRLDHGAAEEGLGIGLAVVHQGAQLLGHALDIDSEPGRGTTVTLGLRRCEPTAATAVDTAPLRPREGALVAVIDDNPEVRAALVSLLVRWSLRVVEADDADGLVALLAGTGEARPALLLVDYTLAHGNGLDAVEQLRERDGWAAMPAVLVTGAMDHDVEQRARALGMEVLFKPVRPRMLQRILAASIGYRPAA